MTKQQTIGKQIKAYRLANQMTQTQMAYWLGIGLGTVVSLEKGRRCKELTLAKVEAKLKGQVAA